MAKQPSYLVKWVASGIYIEIYIHISNITRWLVSSAFPHSGLPYISANIRPVRSILSHPGLLFPIGPSFAQSDLPSSSGANLVPVWAYLHFRPWRTFSQSGLPVLMTEARGKDSATGVRCYTAEGSEFPAEPFMTSYETPHYPTVNHYPRVKYSSLPITDQFP